MKTSIFDMTFVLPPMVEMTEVVTDYGPNTLTQVMMSLYCGPPCRW